MKNDLTLVAGIDFSQPSTAAAGWAISFLHPSETILSHALVVPEIHGLLADRYPLPETLLLTARAGARSRLLDIQRALNVPDAIIDVREGRPADAIAEAAEAYDADLIVVGKHGEGGTHRGYTGRTADRLVRCAPAPVLLANSPVGPGPRTFIVPVTYSSITPHIVALTRKLQERCDATVIILHVIGSAVLSHVLSMSNIRSGETPTSAEIDEIFSDDRVRWEKDFIDAGIPSNRVRCEVVFGEVSESIIAAADYGRADMIIMGSHAGPIRRLLLGSAATAVMHHSTVPVLIVTEPDEPAAVHQYHDAGQFEYTVI